MFIQYRGNITCVSPTHPCGTYIIISSLCNQRRLCFVLSFCNYFSSYRIKQQIESSLLNKFQEEALRQRAIQRGISHFLIISVCLSSLLFLCHCAYDRMRFLYDSLIKQTHKPTRAFTIKSAQTFNTITELDSVKFDQKYSYTIFSFVENIARCYYATHRHWHSQQERKQYPLLIYNAVALLLY